MKSRAFCVYIIANIYNTTFYIGMINDIERRVYEHKSLQIEGFSKRYRLTKLVYYEETDDAPLAIVREKQLKNRHRAIQFLMTFLMVDLL